jgi:hypothetical protein
MAWHPYDLDHLALEIVLKARKLDPDSLNQAYKMRAACAYGLERFWGEHLRLADKEIAKAAFIADVWRAFTGIMHKADPTILLPDSMMSKRADEVTIKAMAQQLWSLEAQDQQVCLAVLTSFCDSIVWWVQRLK